MNPTRARTSQHNADLELPAPVAAAVVAAATPMHVIVSQAHVTFMQIRARPVETTTQQCYMPRLGMQL